MRIVFVSVMVVQAVLVAALAFALHDGVMPLGVRGEWEWLRLPRGIAPTPLDLTIGGIAVATYAGLAGFGLRLLEKDPSRLRECLVVVGLWLASLAAQAIVPAGAPEGYGLSKWALALSSPGSSGYYTVARQQIRDPWRFLADFPEWIKRQDALHIGTHPPGLFLLEYALLAEMDAHPDVAKLVLDGLPPSIDTSFRILGPPQRPDRAALALTGILTLLACASTVVPIYLLARASLSPRAAWSAAALWPVVPSTILFHPASDTAFPFLAATAMAMAAHAGRTSWGRGIGLAFGAGLTLAVGMAFTLAFLPVGLIVGLILLATPGLDLRRRALLVIATGIGFLLPTFVAWAVSGANPFVIWWWNQKNHARFYVEYPRSYLAWLVANPIELMIGIGLPTSVWAIVGLTSQARRVPVAVWATLGTLVFLTLSGKNLSEVGRLWLPMMPALLVAAGLGLERLGAGPRGFATTVGMLGLETLALQATIQVVYPI